MNWFICFCFAFIHDGMCAFGIGICLCFLCFAVFELINLGNTPSVPKERPLGHILNKWAKYCCGPVTKKEMIFYCNSVWSKYMLGSGERWTLNGCQIYSCAVNRGC